MILYILVIVKKLMNYQLVKNQICILNFLYLFYHLQKNGDLVVFFQFSTHQPLSHSVSLKESDDGDWAGQGGYDHNV